MTVANPNRPVWVTSIERVDHAVADKDITPGDLFAGACGELFWPAAMCAPPGPRCGRCLKTLRAPESPLGTEQRLATPRRSRRRTLWSRLISRLSRGISVSPKAEA